MYVFVVHFQVVICKSATVPAPSVFSSFINNIVAAVNVECGLETRSMCGGAPEVV